MNIKPMTIEELLEVIRISLKIEEKDSILQAIGNMQTELWLQRNAVVLSQTEIANLTKKVTGAVDVLKAAIADRYAMVTIENRYGRGSNCTDLENKDCENLKRKGMAELALDILTGEQPVRRN
jgi:hypothetical protein